MEYNAQQLQESIDHVTRCQCVMKNTWEMLIDPTGGLIVGFVSKLQVCVNSENILNRLFVCFYKRIDISFTCVCSTTTIINGNGVYILF